MKKFLFSLLLVLSTSLSAFGQTASGGATSLKPFTQTSIAYPTPCTPAQVRTAFLSGAVTTKVCNAAGNAWVAFSTGGASGDASTNTSSSVDSEIALFSGTGGKTLKRATGSGIATVTSGVLGTASVSAELTYSGGALSVTALGITNGMLAGSIANAKLTNSSITIAGTATSLGASISLDTIDNLAANGLVARSSANTRVVRTLTGTSNQITVTNGDGVSGNPTFSIPSGAQLSIAKITNQTSNGFLKTGSGDGTLSVDTNTYYKSGDTPTFGLTVSAAGNGDTAGARFYISDASVNSGARDWAIMNGYNAYGALYLIHGTAQGANAISSGTVGMVLSRDGKIGTGGILSPAAAFEAAGDGTTNTTVFRARTSSTANWYGVDINAGNAGTQIYSDYSGTGADSPMILGTFATRANHVYLDVNGNTILGATAAGTSAAKVLAIASGTAPSSSPADMNQVYSVDAAAGDSNLYARNEAGEINRLTGLGSVVSTQFDKTSSTTLADVTGLTRNVEAGRVYSFEANLYTSSNAAGGIKASVSGTATATNIIYEGYNVAASAINAQTRATALDTAVCAFTAATAATCTIKGTITVNAAGTLTIQFAQNASNGTASSVLVGSTFRLTPIK